MDIIVSPPDDLATHGVCEADYAVIADWLATQRSAHTRDAYQRDITAFLTSANMPLQHITITEILRYRMALETYADATRNRKLAAIKSLFSYCYEMGYIPFNSAKRVKLDTPKDELAERILSEGQVERILEAETDNVRNHTLLHLLYKAGLRVSEVCALCWRDVKPREQGYGQITVYGKGRKTRHIILKPDVFSELEALRSDALDDAPVFQSRKGKRPLQRRQVERIVQDAATRARVKLDEDGASKVSPHWLRHSHASHSLARKAPVHLVKETLGHKSLVTTSRYSHVMPDDSSALYL